MRFRLSPKRFFLCFVFAFSAAAGASASDTLSLSSCIRLALRNNPSILISEGASETARGQYESSRASLLPQASLQSSYTESQAGIARSGQTRNYGANAQIQQLVTDFGRSRAKTAAGRNLLNATESEALATRQNLILSAHVAYFELLAARSIHKVNLEALALAQTHLQRAKVLLEAGRGVRFNVVKAEVDLENARLNALRAENAEKVSRIELSHVIGSPVSDSLILIDSLAGPVNSVTLDSAFKEALVNRPELNAAKLRLAASEHQLRASRKGYWPALTLSGGYGALANDPPIASWQHGWSGGLSLSAPLFLGGTTQASVRQARGGLMIAQAALKNMEQNINLEIEQQFLGMREAAARIEIAAKMVEQAALALNLAQERFAVGSGNALEISDSELALSNAKVALVQAQADCRITHARLLKAMGKLDKAE